MSTCISFAACSKFPLCGWRCSSMCVRRACRRLRLHPPALAGACTRTARSNATCRVAYFQAAVRASQATCRPWPCVPGRSLPHRASRRAVSAPISNLDEHQNIANLLWGLATKGERADRGLLKAMEKRATATPGEFKPQTLRTCSGGWRRWMRGRNRSLLEAMQRWATATAAELTPQNVANLL